VTDIVERLRHTEEETATIGKELVYLQVPVNPDGPEAANEIERLREELDRQIALKNYATDSGLVLADAVIHARQNGYVLPAWLHNAAINPLDLFLEEKKRRAALKEGE